MRAEWGRRIAPSPCSRALAVLLALLATPVFSRSARSPGECREVSGSGLQGRLLGPASARRSQMLRRSCRLKGPHTSCCFLDFANISLLPSTIAASIAGSCIACVATQPGTRFVSATQPLPYFTEPCGRPPRKPAGTLRHCDLVHFRGRRVQSSCGENVCYAEMERTWTTGAPCPRCLPGVNVSQMFWVANRGCDPPGASNFEVPATVPPAGCTTYCEEGQARGVG